MLNPDFEEEERHYTYNGNKIQITREDWRVYYIISTAPCGMNDYEGWWRPDLPNPGFADALNEAIKGSQIGKPVTAAQQRVLRALQKTQGWLYLGGYGKVGHLSAARALVRRGYAIEGKTGAFAIARPGEEWLDEQAPV